MKTPSDYDEAVAYLEDLPRFTRKHTLAHTKEFLRRLGNPAQDRVIIHVAGTNGKGSVCAFLDAILEAAGMRCGRFLSPHLVKINERILVQGLPVDDPTFYRAFTEVFQVADAMEQEGLEHPSYFEFLFAMALCVFARTDVTHLILETGLGGRLDATNAVDQAALTLITSISLDHTQYLGETIEEIAGEKAGILRARVPVVYDATDPRAAQVICERARELNAPAYGVDESAFEISRVTRNQVAFFRRNGYDKKRLWTVPFGGPYQAINAELALTGAGLLLPSGEKEEARAASAVASMTFPGRMEEVWPHLYVDGAHNPGAIRAFIAALAAQQAGAALKDSPVIVFAAAQDKSYETMITDLCQGVQAKAFIVTELTDERGAGAHRLAETFMEHTRAPVLCEEETSAALSKAFSLRGEGDIYCVGSLYLVGQVKQLLTGGNVRC